MVDAVPELIAEAARRFPEREAIRAAAGAISFRELASEIAGFAATLYGLLRAGASAVLLNSLYFRREVAEYLANAGVSTVVTVSALQEMRPDGIRCLLLDGLHASEDTGRTGAAKQIPDEAVVIYTSATDGWARGARLSHGNLVANARSTAEAMQLLPEDRVVAALLAATGGIRDHGGSTGLPLQPGGSPQPPRDHGISVAAGRYFRQG